MKKLATIILSLILVVPIATALVTTFATQEGKSLDVMFVHDTHSHLNPFSTVEGNESVVMGGFARIKYLINQQKMKNPDTLLLDGGDFSMGTLVQVVYEEEASELRMLGQLGFEVTTWGNHEFDYGAKGMANMLAAATGSGDQLPQMVVCNIDWEGMQAAGLTEDQKLLKDSFANSGIKDYTIITKGDVKIAVVGVVGKDSQACIANCPVSFTDPIESVKRVVEQIKSNETVDMIVCVSHSGTNKNPSKSEDELLAKAVPEIDLIISAHTHTKLDTAIQSGDTYIVSCGEYGKYLGSLSMTQKENGRWTLDQYKLVPVTADLPADGVTQEKVDGFMSLVNEKYLSKFGYTKDQVLATNEILFASQDDTGRLHTELNLGSIMADAYTYAVENAPDFDGHPVDVAVVPSGTIRDTYAKGNITVENVFNSFSLGIGKDGVPGYPLISVYLTGKELKLVAEIDASISDLMTTARLYTDGLYWNYNPNRMILNKVTDVYICNSKGERVELEDDKLYRVVTDYYSSQMLGGVTELSYGLLSIVPKCADGTPIEDYADAVITTEGKQLKAWAAIAQYMESFEDTDGDGIPNVPEVYGTLEGRKVVEDSKAIGDLLKNPNKFFFAIVGILLLVLVIVVLIIVLIVKLVRKFIKKRIAKH